MKTFEEKFTAWVDGKLSGSELAEFERGLESMEEARAEKLAAHRLGDLLRAHAHGAAELNNADFFNHRLMEQIAAAQPRERKERAHLFWTLPRMAWSGAGCLLLACALYFAAVPRTGRQLAHNQQYVAKILSSQAGPGVSATAYHDNDQDVTVLWLEGLDYIPAHHKLK